ncbi:hypothetical protein AWM75_07980 [Aerococcus urinaehominis]|uniref:ATPase AAA-type core domain-containing protein n=1 Tax=Aerococcus urinaehominis TaxID=128944 RepID=A0A109RIA5_9LACT|nr:AAA family ATPase [Aerococcus urinaehominis]AMB99910.1 hypothetical protein AWM75_07980 [Aerococcus urinaehominis]SDM52079.1 hypothetical protein SAMN04487985_1213 [Aerococcus urinaehominis]
MKLLRTEISGLPNFKDNRFIFDLTNDKRVSKEELASYELFPLTNNSYQFPLISLLGINATGKTTSLILVKQMLLLFIQNESLDFHSPFAHYIPSDIMTVNYLTDGKTLYKIVSEIQKDSKKEKIFFKAEKLYAKPLRQSIAHKRLFAFKDSELVLDRASLAEQGNFNLQNFLKDEDSIFSSILNQKDESNLKVLDMMGTTNMNFLSMYSDSLPLSYIHYLDTSIDIFEMDEDYQGHKIPNKFKLKFKGNNEIFTVDYHHLDQYLSSGTIKGISFLLMVTLVLSEGGYLLIDEIENHLNKTIVTSIMRLFQSKINKNRATLIVSTHYQELVDIFSRTDSIYLLRKTDQINIERFSTVLEKYKYDRTDKVKSNLLMSGVLDTAPQYEYYEMLKQDMEGVVNEP